MGGLSAPLFALVLAAAAPNKVAGLAVVKILNAINLLPIAAAFLPIPLQVRGGRDSDLLADARAVVSRRRRVARGVSGSWGRDYRCGLGRRRRAFERRLERAR